MSTLEVTQKANYVGVWLEDVFADELLNRIASRAMADKGKAVKISLGRIGLRVKQKKIFQDSISEFYPLTTIQTVMRNPLMATCVMFVVADPRRKYKIIAFRFNSDEEAMHMFRIFQQIQHNSTTPDVEMKKRVEGNWTLAHRTSHNASRHLAEIFNEKNMQEKTNSNFDVKRVDVDNEENTADASVVLQSTSFSRENSTSANIYDIPDIKGKDSDEEEYVIETEVEPYHSNNQVNQSDVHLKIHNIDFSDSRSTAASELEIAEFKNEINHLTEEVNGLKNIIAKMSVNDSTSISNGNLYNSQFSNGHDIYATPHQNNYATTHQPVYASTQPIYAQPHAMRAHAKTASLKRSFQGDPWASHKRLSQASHAVMMPSKAYEMNSEPSSISRRNSDAGSIRSVGGISQRSLSAYRVVPAGRYYSGTTVARPIEQAYGRQIVLRPGTMVHHHQVHTIGRKKKGLKINHPVQSQDTDIRL